MHRSLRAGSFNSPAPGAGTRLGLRFRTYMGLAHCLVRWRVRQNVRSVSYGHIRQVYFLGSVLKFVSNMYNFIDTVSFI